VKNSFFLVIPEQKNEPQLLASFTDDALRQWVAELPTANPGLAARLFHELLGELISVEMPAAKRLHALELLRDSFYLIDDYLRSRLIKFGFPKGEVEKKIFGLACAIERQFTIGYWSVVKELTRRDVGWLQGKSTALAIQRTIRGLSRIVISHYMMSYPVPDWIWIDLHSLYKLAVKLDKAGSKVADHGGIFSKLSSVEDSYKQILLLSLAYPSGLMQKEFQLVYEFLEKISDFLQIETKPVAEQAVQCVILMDEDLPPAFLLNAAPNDRRSDSAMLYLNLTKLGKVIKQADKLCSKDEARFSSLEVDKNNHQKLSAELFDYLMQRWQGKEPQGTVYFADRLDRYVAIGLETTYDLLETGRPGLESGLEIRAETDSERALSCNFDKEGVLSIGSLVSFRKIDAMPQQRSLGVVCKILLPKQDSKLIYEVMVIAAQAFPVAYQALDADADAERKKALIYGTRDQEGEKSFIIMDSFRLKDGDILRMFMGHENFPIILNGRRNIGLGYWQFECRRILDDVIPAQSKKKGYDFI
jgi:hypothetical protein